MVALLFVGSAILLSSCKEEKRVESVSLDTIKTEESQNLTIVMSENGRRSYRFTTPLLEGYMLGRDPYREFRKGVRIITYQDDSLVSVNSTLDANYAIYYEKRKLWEAKGNVCVEKFDGTKLYTQQLFWDSTTKRIYSNVDTKVVTASDTHYCEGFDSDENLVELKFRRWKGKMAFEEEALKAKDSTAVDNKPATEQESEQEQEQVEPKSFERRRPAKKRIDGEESLDEDRATRKSRRDRWRKQHENDNKKDE
ncbi:MAG: LPS export ABC transporter periplasmic protein LptC [Alistipes sp.]|nr:LPS export ABC transporter periplasmic protein LptC [Alistipes sp.]